MYKYLLLIIVLLFTSCATKWKTKEVEQVKIENNQSIKNDSSVNLQLQKSTYDYLQKYSSNETLLQKLGLTYDGVKTNKMSDAITVNRKFTPEEHNLMQNYVNRGYELFVKRCADGRKMKTEQIKAIAEGRVWTGEDAIKNGLVDKIGGLNDAIAMAVTNNNLNIIISV